MGFPHVFVYLQDIYIYIHYIVAFSYHLNKHLSIASPRLLAMKLAGWGATWNTSEA